MRTTPANAEPRMRLAANLAQVTMVGLQRQGTATTTIDLGLHRALRPTTYDQTMKDQVEDIVETVTGLVSHWNTLVGHGPSGGAAPIIALGKLGLFRGGVLIRDGIKLGATKGPVFTLPDIYKFLRYTEAGKPLAPANAPVVPNASEATSGRTKNLQKFIEIWHYRRLMLGPYTAEGARQLAGDPMLPLCNVAFGHSPAGSMRLAQKFSMELSSIRTDAVTALLQANPYAEPALCRPLLEPELYHSDLVTRPDITARHLSMLLAPLRTD